MSSENTKIVHLFHRPGFREFQKSLIQAISLPIGAKGNLHYGRIWANDTFIEEINRINDGGDYSGLLWALSCLEGPEGKGLVYSFACPIRFLENLFVNTDDPDNYFIRYRAGKYLTRFEKYDSDRLSSATKIAFGSEKAPLPGARKGFIYVADQVDFDSVGRLSLFDLFAVLRDIPSSTTRLGKEPEIKSYPLVKLDDIKGQKAGGLGLYTLKVDKQYTIPYSVYQDDDYRSRTVIINKSYCSGKNIQGEILERIDDGQSQIDIEIEFNENRINIPIYVSANKPLYEKKFFPLVALFAVSIAAIWGFLRFVHPTNADSTYALLTALLVVTLERLFETLKKP